LSGVKLIIYNIADISDLRNITGVVNGGITPNESEKSRMDYNLDGKITVEDLEFFEDIFNGKGVKLGDITGDKTVDNRDVQKLIDYLYGGKGLTDKEILFADMNCDNEVNEKDLALLLDKVNTGIKNGEISGFPYGDVNGDGAVNGKDLQIVVGYNNGETTITIGEKERADIDKNGVVDKKDEDILRDLIGLTSGGNTKGDLNFDSMINVADLVLLDDYLKGKTEFTAEQKSAADMNSDGSINATDLAILQAQSGILVGDIDNNGKLNSNDLNILADSLLGKTELTDTQKLFADTECDTVIDTKDLGKLAQLLKISGNVNGDGFTDTRDLGLMAASLEYDKFVSKLSERERKSYEKYFVNGKLRPEYSAKMDFDGNGEVTEKDYFILMGLVSGEMGYVIGDANLDGKVDYADAVYIIQAGKGKVILSEEQKNSANILAFDNKIDMDDVEFLVKILGVEGFGDINGDKIIDEKDLTEIEKLLDKGSKLGDLNITVNSNFDDVFDNNDKKALEDYLDKTIETLPVFPDIDFNLDLEMSDVYWGDVDLDSRVAVPDVTLLAKYVSGRIGISPKSWNNANIYPDNVVDYIDLALLIDYILGTQPNLPVLNIEGLKVYDYGDVNLDGNLTEKDVELLEKHINGEIELTGLAFFLGDCFVDEVINENDIYWLKLAIEGLCTLPQFPLTEEELQEKLIYYGDIDKDKDLDADDLYLLRRYLDGFEEFDDYRKKAADVYYDKIINELDYVVLENMIQTSSQEIVPAENIIYGDADDNGIVDIEDMLLITAIVENPQYIVRGYQNKAADCLVDNVITGGDTSVLQSHLGFPYISLPQYPSKNTSLAIPYGCLDAGNDVSQTDLDVLVQYLNGEIELDEYELSIADCYKDDVVDWNDYQTLKGYLGLRVVKLPVYPDGFDRVGVYDFGDVDGNGIINYEDTEMLKTVDLSSLNNKEKWAADLFADGVIDTKDIEQLEKYLSGKTNRVKEYPDGKIRVKGYDLGDVDGNGFIEYADLKEYCSLNNKHFYGEDYYGEEYEYAEKHSPIGVVVADTDGDGIITVWDEIGYNTGDANRDGIIDEADLGIFEYFLASEGAYEKLQNKFVNGAEEADLGVVFKNVNVMFGDIDRNGEITLQDYKLLQMVAQEGNYDVFGFTADLIDNQGVTSTLKDTLGVYDGLTDISYVYFRYFLEGKITDFRRGGSEWAILPEYPYGTVSGEVILKENDVNLNNVVDVNDLRLVLLGVSKVGGVSYAATGVTGATYADLLMLDVNGDGVVNSKDAAVLRGKTGIGLGDVNCDNFTNTADLRLLVGFIEKYANPIESKVRVIQEGIFADLNSDGVLDEKDKALMLKLIAPANGDIDSNGIINIKDIAILADYLRGNITLTDTEKSLADANSDGKVNEVDTAYLRSLTGLESTIILRISETNTSIKTINGVDVEVYDYDKNYPVTNNINVSAKAQSFYQIYNMVYGYSTKNTLLDKEMLNILADFNGDNVLDNKDIEIAFAESGLVLGDVDLSGNVEVGDIEQLMLQMGKKYSKSNLTPIFVRSDLNFDNQVNEEDYEILKDLINFDWDLNGDLVVDNKELRSFIDGVKGDWAENSFYYTEADLNADGAVDNADIMIMYEKTGVDIKDINLDGEVNLNDARRLGSGIYYGDELFADLDNDGKVDREDEKILLEFLGVEKGDLNQNGAIDMPDFIIFSDYMNGVTDVTITENYLMDMDFNGEAWDIAADSKDFELFTADFKIVKGDVDANNALTELDLWHLEEAFSMGENYLYYYGSYIKTAETFTAVMDMNGDGFVDYADSEEMRISVGLVKGDVTLDKVVDEADLELFKEYLAGNITFNDTQKYCGDIDCSSTYLWGFAADGSDLKELEKMLAA
jgi:hypothetical protein